MGSLLSRALRASLAIALGVLASCDDALVACTTEFRAVFIAVVDSTNAPVPDAVVTSILSRSGDTLSVAAGVAPTGLYPILDDAARGKLTRSGEAVAVTAQRGPTMASATYVFDVPGGCHINKVSGPDTLTIE